MSMHSAGPSVEKLVVVGQRRDMSDITSKGSGVQNIDLKIIT